MIKLPQLSSKQIDGANIGLMVISLVISFFIPFELFLFSYAILGPLHYLTEISWLHQKNYYVPGKKDFRVFLIMSVLLGIGITLSNYLGSWEWSKAYAPYKISEWGGNIIIGIFAIAFILVVLRKFWVRAVAFVALLVIMFAVNVESRCYTCTNQAGATKELCTTESKAAQNFVRANCVDTDSDGFLDVKTEFKFPFTVALFTAYLPTLIHVFLFTSLFMLFGALKSKSKLGIAAVGFHFVCAAIALFLPGDIIPYSISEWGKSSYDVSFLNLNQTIFEQFHLGGTDEDTIYRSGMGIALTRFIAFAYTYHYLNWFSKTSIIQWHKMPALNLIVVLVLWGAAIGLYLWSYELGLMWLFFLSFLHVFMEFPLNFQSIVGIGKSLFGGSGKTSAPTGKVKTV